MYQQMFNITNYAIIKDFAAERIQKNFKSSCHQFLQVKSYCLQCANCRGYNNTIWSKGTL